MSFAVEKTGFLEEVWKFEILLELMLFVLVLAAVQFESYEARMGKLELVRLLELLEEDSLS